jgi:hypothetical protein
VTRQEDGFLSAELAAALVASTPSEGLTKAALYPWRWLVSAIEFEGMKDFLHLRDHGRGGRKHPDLQMTI